MSVVVNEVTGEVVVVKETETAMYIEETTPATVVVYDVGMQGPQGPAGPAGGEGYTHTQISASSSWYVLHNLGRNPAVVVIDSANQQVHGDVFYLSVNEVELTFSAPFSGIAELI